MRPPVAIRVAQLAAAAALLAFGLHGAGLAGPDGPGWTWLFKGAIALAALVVLARARRGGPEGAAWLLIGLCSLIWVAGDAYYSLKVNDDPSPPVPAWSDLGYLGSYLPAYTGTLLLGRRLARSDEPHLWLDGVMGALALTAASIALVVSPVLRSATTLSTAGLVVNVSYPLCDLVLIFTVVGVAARSGWRLDRRLALIAAGYVVFTVADSVFLSQVAADTYVQGGVLDLGWALGPLATAVAAWLPAPAARHRGPVATDGRTLAMPMVFATLALAVLAVVSLAESADPWAAGCAVVAMAVVVVRMALAQLDSRVSLRHSRRDAVTDQLTGLANRRALMADLQAAEVHGRWVLTLFDLDGFKAYNDTFGHAAGDELLRSVARAMQQAAEDHERCYRLGGDEFCVLAEDHGGAPEVRGGRLASAMTQRGEGYQVGASFGATRIGGGRDAAGAALREADERMYAVKGARHGAPGRQTSDALLVALHERLPELGGRAQAVAELAATVARRMGLDERTCERTRVAAALHDIGMLAIPDAILNSARGLDEDEWRFVRRHTEVGTRVLQAAPALADVAGIVRASHERMDGTGYPDGLAGEEIPVESRVVLACDAFDAMVSERPHQPERSTQAAVVELWRCAGTQFDPEVVAALDGVVTEESGRPAAPAVDRAPAA